MTVRDIVKAAEFPNAAHDASGKLLCGAAVSVGAGTEERIEALVEAGVTSSALIPLTATPRACWTASTGLRRTTRTFR